MENVWLIAAVWLGPALLTSIISIRVAMSVALVEIIVGAAAGNTLGLHLSPYMRGASSANHLMNDAPQMISLRASD